LPQVVYFSFHRRRRATIRRNDIEIPKEGNARQRPLVELKEVTRSYREGDKIHHVLDRLGATVHAGEIVVLLGRSGSGKSTLLNLISAIDRPDSGEILIEGVPLSSLDEGQRTVLRRRRIGFVFQFFNLIPTLTVEENLLLPLELQARGDGRYRASVREMLAAVGLESRAQSFPDRLSGGEQQRVAVARALIHEPTIVLADEPTGNLDLETGRQVIELLDRLVRRRGRTMILATHSRELIGLADRIVTLKEGRLIPVPPDEVS